MNRDDSLISASRTDVVATPSDTEQCLADLGAQSSAASVPSYSETLSRIYAELPDSLKTISQGVSCCPKSFFLPQHPLDLAPGVSFSLPMPQALSSPPLHSRRDENSGLLFIENSARFTITQEGLDGVPGLRIHNCRDFVIDLGGAEVQEEFATRPKFFLHLSGCNGFALRNVTARGGRNLALIECCDRFSATGIACSGYEGYGLILLHSRSFSIRECLFDGNLASGILVIGDCQDGTISDCQCTGSTGYYNWDAGLHITHCSRNVTIDDVPERCHEALPIREKVMRPRRIHVLRSTFANNRAQGIYLEGAQECVLSGNTLAGNNKEGICFDWGTSACLFIDNIVRENGYRSNMTEFEITADFVADFPLMPDQSSTCKLPGVAFDNGVLNAIINNDIRDNFGGGLKMVRSAIGNLIQGNTFSKNSRGENFFVKRVYDVYILSLGNRGGEFDDDRNSLLDFLASSFNVFRDNRFSALPSDAVHYGKEHNFFARNEFSNQPVSATGLAPDPSERCPKTQITADSEDGVYTVCPNTLYAFGSVTGKHLAILRLAPGGHIQFSPHPNETHWRVEDDELLFFDRSFNVSTSFSAYTGKKTVRPAFVGQFHHSSVLHYLVALLSVAHRGTGSTFPPLLINTSRFDRPLLPFFIALFRELGWATTGLHCRPDRVDDYFGLDAPDSTRADHGLPCSAAKVASILMPGQSLSGHLPLTPELRAELDGIFTVLCTRDLRLSFLAEFLREEGTEPRSAAQTAWRYLKDPHDRFLVFLEASIRKHEHDILNHFAKHDDSATPVLHYEDLHQPERPPVSLLRILEPFGIGAQQASSAMRTVAASQAPCHSSAAAEMQPLWSEVAERVFQDSPLGRLNLQIGYAAPLSLRDI